jgi:hypothetical protein
MDTSYYFPNIGGAIQQGVQTQQALQDQPYRLELLRQAALQAPLETQEKQFQLAQAYNQAGILSALNQRIAQRLNSQSQDLSPNDQPSATGGGGSSGGSVGSNAGGHVSVASGNNGTAAPSPASTPNGTAQSGAGLQIPQGPHYDPNEGLTADPMLMQGLAVTMPNLAKGLLESQESQQKLAQFQAQGPLNFIDSVVNNTSPEKLLMANPGLQARYRQVAPQLGIDPNDPAQMTTNNVRQVFGFMGNQIRGQVGLQPKEVPLQQQVTHGPAGEVYATNPVTNEPKQITGPDLKAVIVNGQPQLVPADQAVGKAPYNQVSAGVEQLKGTPAGQLQAALDARGVQLPGTGRSPAVLAARLQNLIQANPNMSPEEIADGLRTGQLDFGGAKRSTAQLSTVLASADAQATKLDKDFQQLEPLINKLPDGPAVLGRTLTSLKNNFSFGGDKDSAALVVYLKEAASEYAKLNNGMTGGAAPAEGQLNEALSIMQNAYTKGGFQGIKTALLQSAQNKRDAYREGLQNASKTGAGVGSQGTSLAPAPGTQVSDATRAAVGLPPNGKPSAQRKPLSAFAGQ